MQKDGISEYQAFQILYTSSSYDVPYKDICSQINKGIKYDKIKLEIQQTNNYKKKIQNIGSTSPEQALINGMIENNRDSSNKEARNRDEIDELYDIIEITDKDIKLCSEMTHTAI